MPSESVHSTKIYDRSYFLATGVVLYVTLAACQAVGFGWPAYALLAGAPLWLAGIWRFTRRSLGSEVAQVEVSALGALRVSALGAAVWLAARLCVPGRPALDLAANVGLGAAIVAANVALARIPAREGLVQPPRSARSLDAALFSALLWCIPSALSACRLLWRGEGVLLDPVATDYASNAASIASVLELSAAGLRLRSVRGLELGVLERARAAVVIGLGALFSTIPISLLDLAAPYYALPAGALAAGLGCAWVAALRDPTRIARALRGGLLVLVLGAPLALGTGALVARWSEQSGLIALGGCGLALFVGVLGRSGAWPFAAAELRRLKVLAAASRALSRAEPNTAVLAVLESLQGLQQTIRTRPELWRLDPAEMLSADVAGYLHTEAGAAPQEIYELAQSEPERVLRREVLAELQVRRPEVRAALSWLDARGAFAVGLVREEQGPIGLLLLPEGARGPALTLAQARAIRELCDRLSIVLGVSSALARARTSEAEALARVDKLEQERSRLETRIVGQTRHRDSVAEVLADGVRVATYGTRARRTLRELERHAAGARDVSLDVPVGVDALAWACAYHQTGTGRTGPLVVSDGTTAATHPPGYWSHETDAPTRRAEGGTLVVLHVTALPEPAQLALAEALSARSRDGARPCVLVATASEAPERALEQGRLCAALAWYLVPHSLRLPALRERAEDLRGLVLAQLLASGVRRAGGPLGIEPQALAQLVAHGWPGNDAELSLVVQRAARVASAERVTLTDLVAAGFAGSSGALPAAQSLPPAAEPAARSERAPALARRSSARAAAESGPRGRKASARRGASESAVTEVTRHDPGLSDPPLSERAEAELGPVSAILGSAQVESAGSERPAPKRSERVRKARVKAPASSVRTAAQAGPSADASAGSAAAAGALEEPSASETSSGPSSEQLPDVDVLQDANARPAARRRRRR